MYPCSAVDLWYNDLFEYDPASMTWKVLSSMVGDTSPSPSRDSKAFTLLGGKFYRFGGQGFQGWRLVFCT